MGRPYSPGRVAMIESTVEFQVTATNHHVLHDMNVRHSGKNLVGTGER